MKFKHDFELKENDSTFRIYQTDCCSLRLDFIEHMVRVAIIKDRSALLPTFTVRPRLADDPATGAGLIEFPKTGRDKLSIEGLNPVDGRASEEENVLSFEIDDICAKVDLFNFKMSFYKNDKLLFSDREYISYNFDQELGDGSFHFITREADEKIFGLGDKTGDINKNGRSFKIGASDAMGFDARSSDPLYKQLPFYICENSVGAYGIYYDTYSNGEMNFGSEINNYYAPFKSFRCDEENLVFYIIFGSVPEIANRFSKLCGPVLFPPRWTFSYSGSTMSYTDAPDADAQLRGFVDLCRKYDLNPGGFYLSSGYTQIGEKRYVFHWNTDKIPSPENLSAYYRDNGIEIFPNVKPAFLVNHPMYKDIADKGWFLHYENGAPAIFPFWDDYGSYLDFTNPNAYSFWTDCIRKQLVDKGYKNIWNDNNEYDICDKEVLAHGFGNGPISAHRIRPLFSFLMTMASLEAQDSSIRTVSVSRCGIGGLSRIATTWTGDNNTSFDDFRYNHKMAMTMSLSGFFNFGQDIGGFAGPRPGKELFLRWIQYGIFTPRFVLHSWNPDGIPTMPWLYEELIPTVKKLFDLRDSFVPYLYNEVYRSSVKNEPIIYPVFLKQKDYDVEADCFYFGDSILAAPVFDEGATSVSVLLPSNCEGWYLRDGSPFEPSQSVDVPCSTFDMPVFFVKAGSVIPYADVHYDTRSNSCQHINFTVYAAALGTFTYSFLSDDGINWLEEGNHEIIEFRVTCTEDAVAVSHNGPDNLTITLVDHLGRQLVVNP